MNKHRTNPHQRRSAVQYALPMLLAVNTFALLAIEQLGGIPDWIKSAVALFLGFLRSRPSGHLRNDDDRRAADGAHAPDGRGHRDRSRPCGRQPRPRARHELPRRSMR